MATFMAPSTVTINLILSMLFLFLFLFLLWQSFYMTVSAVHCNLQCLLLIFFGISKFSNMIVPVK